ncbi:GLIPR1-like protein 1 [Melanotaenia boesemani]|uniref:GLIPR1-like protein 1 n=1 Tax=Melanotaenia boesemani TaxID=1250792 RepID=UPI001C04ADFC|nr:GLIPR1-like protein 1 [Melanotaenia boesemani]
MGCVMEMLLWVGIVLDSGLCSVLLPEINDRTFIDECVRKHNMARTSVDPPASDMLYMTWDEGLAITARAWARHCTFKHNIYLKDVRRVHPTFSSVGENIWTGYPPSSFNVSRAIRGWVNETQYYDYEKNSCTNVCGHYTQVVWASSYKVGCAVQLCSKGVTHFTDREGAIFVCNYATAGNINRRRPYQSQGVACSGCKGTCENSLCSDEKRDSQQKYNWAPDWDPALTTSGSDYATVLITRPIALIFTFTAAYIVRYFYPNIFCYE